jgi:hypothetical protein
LKKNWSPGCMLVGFFVLLQRMVRSPQDLCSA